MKKDKYKIKKGIEGEQEVEKYLEQLPQKDYTIFNDILIKTNDVYHQIDYIVVSKYGIFVIEVKNFEGKVIGNEHQYLWFSYRYNQKISFENPIIQNSGHVKCLQNLLNLPDRFFLSLICFTNKTNLNVNISNTNINNFKILKSSQILGFINKYKKILIFEEQDIDYVKNIINKNNIFETEDREKHITILQNKKLQDSEKTKKMICPICNNSLTYRYGKKGKFIGCTNYYKCNFTLKITT